MANAGLTLPAALEKFVAAQVEEGAYRSRQAAINGAVAGERRCAERRASLAQDIQKGFDSGSAELLNVNTVIYRGRGCLSSKNAIPAAFLFR